MKKIFEYVWLPALFVVMFAFCWATGPLGLLFLSSLVLLVVLGVIGKNILLLYKDHQEYKRRQEARRIGQTDRF